MMIPGMKTGRHFRNIILLTSFISLLFFSQTSFAQAVIKGNIVFEKDDSPASYVNIELVQAGVRSMADNAGNFHLNITESQKKDSLIITAVGYKTLRMPVLTALAKSKFTLRENTKTIEGVTVFNSHEVIGSTSENVGYYKSWSPKVGGEVGRIFNVPYKKFKIDKIRFKVTNTCDTCLLRVHIRYIKQDGEPGNEMFSDSISVFVNNLSLDSKVSEFDLTPYDFIFKEKNFYVGLELLSCGNGKKGSCAFNFAGTEKGEYLFRPSEDASWKYGSEYTVHLKLFLRY